MSRIAYVNGRYLPQPDASVNIEDRGYQFGDGIYEVVHLYRGRTAISTGWNARCARSACPCRWRATRSAWCCGRSRAATA